MNAAQALRATQSVLTWGRMLARVGYPTIFSATSFLTVSSPMVAVISKRYSAGGNGASTISDSYVLVDGTSVGSGNGAIWPPSRLSSLIGDFGRGAAGTVGVEPHQQALRARELPARFRHALVAAAKLGDVARRARAEQQRRRDLRARRREIGHVVREIVLVHPLPARVLAPPCGVSASPAARRT